MTMTGGGLVTTTGSDRAIMLWRGLRRRCPRCEADDLFHRWTEMVEICPRCELEFEHEEGYWVGAVAVNFLVTELLFAALLTIVVLLTWPDVPMVPLIVGGLILNIAFPIFFYPISKTLWVAIDLSLLHPLKPWRRRKPESMD